MIIFEYFTKITEKVYILSVTVTGNKQERTVKCTDKSIAHCQLFWQDHTKYVHRHKHKLTHTIQIHGNRNSSKADVAEEV
jgi:hypothetical protein